MAEENAIVVQNLTKSFKDLKVLDGLNLTVKRGTMLALLGPNGAGKTTTIRILSTLLKQDSGTAIVNGIDVANHPDKVRENIGLTGQYAAVDEYLSGIENLIMMGKLYHLSAENANRRAQELLEQFDLMDAANRQVKTYSGGMRRRLDLALSLIATPPVIFLDEPTTGLDPRSRLAMWDIIKKLVEADVTILLTTQYLDEADQLADRIAVLDGGKIIAEGTAEELKARVGSDRMELVLKSSDDFNKAVALLGSKLSHKDEKKRSLSVATGGGVREVKETIDQMEQAGIQVDALSLHKPTLDDVFLNLTGHKAEKEQPEEEIK